jgi:uncharacterized membrane protein AbrB (regulator of aidB expression)
MDTNPFDQPQQHHGATFVKVFAASFIGAVIGASLDNTRFGRWFNTSKLIGLIFKLFGLYCVYLAGVFVYELIKVW